LATTGVAAFAAGAAAAAAAGLLPPIEMDVTFPGAGPPIEMTPPLLGARCCGCAAADCAC